MRLKNSLNKILVKKKSLLAFNIQNIDQLEALADACVKLKKNAICQFSTRYFLLFQKFYNLEKIIRIFKKKNIFFFLDHCDDIKIIKKCIKYKFDGVMYDGSKLNLKKNILNTNKIKKLLISKQILLEAEIGPVYGNEDDYKSSKNKLKKNDLVKFIEKAKFDLLAIGAGNTHGYVKKSKINFSYYDLAKNNKKYIKLVFHGGSGVNTKTLKNSQKKNVVKINFSSSLKREMKIIYKNFLIKNTFFDVIKFKKFTNKYLQVFYLKLLSTYS